MTVRIYLADTTRVLLDEIEAPESTRDTLAVTYGLAIRSGSKTEWATVNRAIIERWSRSALEYIKKRAWKLVETPSV